MDTEYATYPSRREDRSTGILTVFFCCVAACAITLAGVAMSKANDVDRRVDGLMVAPSSSSVASSSSSKVVSLLGFNSTSLSSELNKASSALGLHHVCRDNAQMCANVVESANRLMDGLNCDKVRNGDYSFNGVDVVLSSAGKVTCAGPKFTAQEGSAVPSSNCDLELTGVCIYGGSDSNINVVFHKEANEQARRGQGSFDANAGWNQQQGASVSVGFHYTWGGN